MNTKEFGFINDGDCFDRTIEGVPGLFPDVQLSLKLCNWLERSKWLNKKRKLEALGNDDITEKKEVEFIASRIASWSLDRDPTPENVLRLVWRLRQRIYDIILGEGLGEGSISGNALQKLQSLEASA